MGMGGGGGGGGREKKKEKHVSEFVFLLVKTVVEDLILGRSQDKLMSSKRETAWP